MNTTTELEKTNPPNVTLVATDAMTPIHADLFQLENFVQAFRSGRGSCRIKCACGREFYNSNGGWDWEPGELKRLEESKATDLEWTVATIKFEGKEYVIDCSCWHARAEILMKGIDAHAYAIAEYLFLEKQRKLKVAEMSPVVR